ncbi:unnamed protein product [Phytomonas sp. EM1]|nr:unnamed protein product [Phytomonas sp. EM1]|eukprot:CCW63842.1 unnamed protein product [Phytomonas sp. isolate EM1]
MVQLSFFEEIADKASRLLPTPYMEIVEECTKPELSVPPYEHVFFLCKKANNKPGEIVDIVRALRRRISDDNFAVKHLMVLLLDVMVRNCGLAFHAEVCAQKGLLRDLVNVATSVPTSAREVQAHRAALTLVLNLSIWFAGHPDLRCRLLATLANDVRQLAGPNAFDDITPNVNARIHLGDVPPDSGCAKSPSAIAGGRGRGGCAALPADAVHAIAIDLPTEERISAMLDTCVALSEYVDNAQVDAQGNVIHDAVVVGFLQKVEEDHNYVTILLSSNLAVDRDVLRAISDNQANVIDRVRPRRLAPGAPVSSGPPKERIPTEASSEQPPESQAAGRSKAVEEPPSIDQIFSSAAGRAGAGSALSPAPLSENDAAGEEDKPKKEAETGREGEEHPEYRERVESEHATQDPGEDLEQQQSPPPDVLGVAAEATTTEKNSNVAEVPDEKE